MMTSSLDLARARFSRSLWPVALAFAGAVGCTNEIPVGVLPEVAPALPSGASVSGACDAAAAHGVSTLASDLVAYFTPLHLSGDTLYFTVKAGVMKMPLAGGTPTLLNTNQAPYPQGDNPHPAPPVGQDIVVVGSTVYVLSSTGIFSVPVAGGLSTTLHVHSRTPSDQLAADTASLYWTEGGSGDSGDPAEASMMTMLLDGGRARVLTAIGIDSTGVIVDDTDLYWTQHGDRRVRRMPKGGGQATTIATDPEKPRGIVMGQDRVYWRNEVSASAAPTAGGAATSFGAGEKAAGVPSYGALGIAVNATHVYWFEDTFDLTASDNAVGSKLVRAPIAGGATEVVATLDAAPSNRPIACPGGVCWAAVHPDTFTVSIHRYNDCP